MRRWVECREINGGEEDRGGRHREGVIGMGKGGKVEGSLLSCIQVEKENNGATRKRM